MKPFNSAFIYLLIELQSLYFKKVPRSITKDDTYCARAAAIAELNAAVEASKEVVRLANLLKVMEIDFDQTLIVFVDIQARIALSKNSRPKKLKKSCLEVKTIKNKGKVFRSRLKILRNFRSKNGFY